MIFCERLTNLSFWFSWSFSIVTIFSSASSARKANTLLSLFISKKRVNIFSFLFYFFIVNNRFFNILISLFNSSKTIKSWVTFVAILINFFSRKENSISFFLWNTQIISWFESIWKTEKQLKTTIRFYEKKKKKNDKRRKNLSFFKINKKEVETFQRIKHHKVREFSQNNKIFRDERKNFENQKTSFDYFLCEYNFFFRLIINLLKLEINFVQTSKKMNIIDYHLRSSRIKSRTIRYFSIENRTQHTSFAFESKKNWTYIQFFSSNKKNRESRHSDCSNYTCFEQSSNERHYERSTADNHIMSRRNQITFQISQFSFLTLSWMSVFLNTS